MTFFTRNMVLILLSALTILLVMLIFETSWPVAYVNVVSTPSGATVSDSDGFIWTTPAWIPVQHNGLSIEVSHVDRVSVDTVLTPDMSTEPVLVSLPYSFPVGITSEPSGALVIIDGSSTGCTPLNITIDEPGIHYIRLILDNLIELEDSFTLLANNPDSFHYSLPRYHSTDLLFVPLEVCNPSLIQKSYLISRYEVTNSEFCEYLRVMDPVPAIDTTNRWGRTDVLESIFPGDYPLPYYIDDFGKWTVQDGFENNPEAGLTFNSAEDYCLWITSMDTSDTVYRLPLEDEWYTAALAGCCGPWPWGSRRPDGNLLNLSDRNENLLRRHPSLDDGYSLSAPVGSFPSNNWGLYDMSGNVWEYCRPANQDSTVVVRGGSWLSSMDDCMCEARMYTDTSLGFPYIGFRISASAGQQE